MTYKSGGRERKRLELKRHLGIITVGQTPRDELVAEFAASCPDSGITIVGALDETTHEERQTLRADDGQYPIRCQLRNGEEVTVGKKGLLPRIQGGIDALEARGVDAVVIGCNSSFPPFRHSVPILQPSQIANQVVSSLAGGLTLGCIVPLPEQVSHVMEEFKDMGVECIALAAGPGQPLQEVALVATALENMGADLIFLRCFGFDGTWKLKVAKAVSVPVVSPVTITASIAAALLN